MVFVKCLLNKVEFILNDKSYFELFTNVYNYLKLQDPFIDQNSFNLIFTKNDIDYIIDNNYEINENEYKVVLKNSKNMFKYYYCNEPYKLNINSINNNSNKLIELLCKFHNIINGNYEIIIIDNNNNIFYKSDLIIKTYKYRKNYSCYDTELIINTEYIINKIDINNKIDFDNLIFILNINELI